MGILVLGRHAKVNAGREAHFAESSYELIHRLFVLGKPWRAVSGEGRELVTSFLTRKDTKILLLGFANGAGDVVKFLSHGLVCFVDRFDSVDLPRCAESVGVSGGRRYQCVACDGSKILELGDGESRF